MFDKQTVTQTKKQTKTKKQKRWDYALDKFFSHLKTREKADTFLKYYSILQSESAYRVYDWFRRDPPRWSEVYFFRLAQEFRLIEEKGFWDVFEQVQQIIGWMNELGGGMQNVVRGSSGSSLTCYLLGITAFDPIEHKISLARFMHSMREDLPDIDIDVPAHLRLILYQKIFETWSGRVARISNHLFYRPKSALRQAIRQAGWNHPIPKHPSLEELFPDQPHKHSLVRELTEELVDKFRGYSLHCGGIVVFPEEVPERYILGEWDMGNGKVGCQVHLNKDDVEDQNLIKIDLLSNRGLSILYELSPGKKLDTYPLDSEKTWELLQNGNTIGVTYAETPAMRKVFQGLKPTKLADLACGLALIRPAASGGGQKVAYLRYHMGENLDNSSKMSHWVPLEPCDGCPFEGDDRPWIIYDDDAIQWIQRWLGCNEAHADGYRKAFTKNRKEGKMDFEDELRQVKGKSWTEEQIRWVCTHLEQLQDYSFCKSHAYSYAQLVYALAWEKVHRPLEFWEACLKHAQSSYRRWVYVREAVAVGSKAPLQTKKGVKISNYFNLINDKKQTDDWDDFSQKGYWWGNAFLSGCGVQWENGVKQPGRISFRGIVATGRIYLPDRQMKPITAKVSDWPEEKMEGQTVTAKTGRSRWITFVTLGIDNQNYIDIVLWGRYPIGSIQVIEGWGEWNETWVTVHKVKVLKPNSNIKQQSLPNWGNIKSKNKNIT